MDEESALWLERLAGAGADHEDALQELLALLLRVARHELARRRTAVTGPELDDLAHQAAADAMVAILAKLATFRGESRFTTWAYRFVVLEVSSKLGRHYWRRASPVLELDEWHGLPEQRDAGPDDQAESAELVAAVRRAVREVLTPHQRETFVAIVVNSVPLDALVAREGTTRNAVYKTMFDARRKIRSFLVANGYLDEVQAR